MEADLKESLRGNEPFKVDFPRSRTGRLKGEAVLRFHTYDQLLAAIHRFHGNDTIIDEAINRSRFLAAGADTEEDQVVDLLKEAKKPAEAIDQLLTEAAVVGPLCRRPGK